MPLDHTKLVFPNLPIKFYSSDRHPLRLARKLKRQRGHEYSPNVSLNHRERRGRAHMSACGWMWVCCRGKFSFAALGLLSPCHKNSIIPRSQRRVKSAVLLKGARHNLKPQTENSGKKKLFGWLSHRWHSCQQPEAGSPHLVVFQEKMQMTHLSALWFISKPTCSLLAKPLPWRMGTQGGRKGGRRARRKWNRYLVDFLYFSFCLHPGRNLPALFKRITQFVPFVRQREPWGPRCLRHGAGVSDGQKTFPRLSVSL